MEYARFGRTGALVSKLGLGGAPLGGDFGHTDESGIIRMIDCALDCGITFIDTAPLYGRGQSELLIGRALAEGKRNGVFLSSKAVRSDQAYTYEATIKSVEASLKRLNTDWIDVLHIHDVETQAPELIEEQTLPALERLRQDGKIRFIAASSRNLQVLRSLLSNGRLDSIQFYGRYMLLDCTAKEQIIPMAEELDIGIVNGSVLGMGLLAGTPAAFWGDDIVSRASVRLRQLSFLNPIGEPSGWVEPAMRFSLGHPSIHVTLTGTMSEEELLRNVAYCDGKGLPAEQVVRINEAFSSSPFFD